MITNILNKTKVYLVGHMQYANGRGWRDEITPELEKMGITVFNPYSKPFIGDADEGEARRAMLAEWMKTGEYDKVAARMKIVRNFDLRLCDLSDFIIAHINPSIASWGSAEEIFVSARMRKPIFLIVEGGKQNTPLWLMSVIPHKYIYNNIGEVVDTLNKIDTGTKTIDSDRWKLLRPEYR